MSSLFGSLYTASNALDVIGQAIGVAQNNVSNASTPGYVTQTLNLAALPSNVEDGYSGGVEATGTISSRNVYAEQAVWSASQQAGYSSQQATSLNALQSYFDVSGTTGIPSALSSLYSAFSSWSSNPTSTTTRQQVLTAATNFSQAVNSTASNVQQLRGQTDTQLSSVVSQINSYSSEIAGINKQIQLGDQNDGGTQAQLYNTIEQLSKLAPVTVQTESDGTATVLLGGQSPLVIGANVKTLSVTYPPVTNPAIAGAQPDAVIQNSDGQDVTAPANQGQLGGLLAFRNTTIPSVIGDSSQQGSLNQFAQGIADRVNTILENGQVSSGTPGQALFAYTAGSPTSVAGTLSLSSSITAANLAAMGNGSANGSASELANLSTSQNSADQINGLTYTDFYSSIASGIGQSEATASANQTSQDQELTQAQTLRSQVSGVSLNDQAALILQYQESYQAAARVISTIDNTVQYLFSVLEAA